MMRAHLSEADHARVSAAVTRAEAGTDGEIVTIVTGRSDSYHDVGLHYAVAAMLLVAASPAVAPRTRCQLGCSRPAGPGAGLATRFLALMIAEVFLLIVGYGLSWMPLRIAMTPRATRAAYAAARSRSSRRRREARTAARTGILLYLSLDERMAEIVADEAIHKTVPPNSGATRWRRWSTRCARPARRGHGRGGGADRHDPRRHFPKTEDDRNELPDRLIEL